MPRSRRGHPNSIGFPPTLIRTLQDSIEFSSGYHQIFIAEHTWPVPLIQDSIRFLELFFNLIILVSDSSNKIFNGVISSSFTSSVSFNLSIRDSNCLNCDSKKGDLALLLSLLD